MNDDENKIYTPFSNRIFLFGNAINQTNFDSSPASNITQWKFLIKFQIGIIY